MTRTRLRLVLVPRAVRSAACRSPLRQSCTPGQCPVERFPGVSARFRQSGRTQHKSISVTHSVARPADRSQPLSFCLCQPSGQRRQHVGDGFPGLPRGHPHPAHSTLDLSKLGSSVSHTRVVPPCCLDARGPRRSVPRRQHVPAPASSSSQDVTEKLTSLSEACHCREFGPCQHGAVPSFFQCAFWPSSAADFPSRSGTQGLPRGCWASASVMLVTDLISRWFMRHVVERNPRWTGHSRCSGHPRCFPPQYLSSCNVFFLLSSTHVNQRAGFSSENVDILHFRRRSCPSTH